MTEKYESMMINTAIFELNVPLIPSFIIDYFLMLTPRSFSITHFSIKAPLSFLYSMYLGNSISIVYENNANRGYLDSLSCLCSTCTLICYEIYSVLPGNYSNLRILNVLLTWKWVKNNKKFPFFRHQKSKIFPM